MKKSCIQIDDIEDDEELDLNCHDHSDDDDNLAYHGDTANKNK